MATLRRDGFASMDAGGTEEILTTRPIRFQGEHSMVNVDASMGELRAEVLDEKRQVISPFTRDNCTGVSVDKTMVRLRWRGVEDLSELGGRTVRFRFYLRDGAFYAFWVSPDGTGASHGCIAAGGPGFTNTRDTVGQDAELELGHKDHLHSSTATSLDRATPDGRLENETIAPPETLLEFAHQRATQSAIAPN